MMKTSQQGLDLLMEREGIRNKAYLDTADPPVWTIGIGHTGPEVHEGLYWTDDHVKAAFADDLERFEKALNDNITVGLEQYQFDALVSWLFNVGTGWAYKPAKLIRLVNENKIEMAAAEFDQWHIPASITSRRNGEREQFAGRHFVARYP